MIIIYSFKTLTWISHRCTCVPRPEPHSHLPPQSHPSGSSHAPALSTRSHASNLDWWSISHMIIYMFQCYSLKSSHLAFSHRVRKSVLYICISFAVSHIGSSLNYHLSKFYICLNILYWCFSFWLTSLCIIGSHFIHLIRTDSNAFFLIAEQYSIVYMYHSFLTIHLLMDI